MQAASWPCRIGQPIEFGARSRGPRSGALEAADLIEDVAQPLWRGEKWGMIRVDPIGLAARRSLLHGALELQGDGAVAGALDVIARDAAPALRRRLDGRAQRRAGLGDESRLGERDIFVRALRVKSFTANFLLEETGSVGSYVQSGWIDHALRILRRPSGQRVAVARQERAHVNQ